ncbi:MAG TPA: EAL domain-containing protein [Steroidobacteraceae bacterium]|nr:EAL domain-containing protein [Steroidobacteraceae bacterium]
MNAAEPTSRLPPLWPHLAWPIGLLLCAVLALTGWAAARSIAARADGDDTTRMSAIARHFVYTLDDRLTTADGWIRSVTAGDAALQEGDLRRRALDSAILSGLVLVPWDAAFGAAGTASAGGGIRASDLRGFDASEGIALAAGRSLLRLQSDGAGGVAVYLAHVIEVRGRRQIGLFELAPGWLWQDADELPGHVVVAVIDEHGEAIFRGSQLPAGVSAMLVRASQEVRHPGEALLRGWQQSGTAWRAAVTQFSLDATPIAGGGSWAVAVYDRPVSVAPAVRSLVPALLMGLLLGALALLGLSLYAARRWRAPLARLHAALGSLREGVFQRVDLGGTVGPMRTLAAAYNLAIDELQQRLAAQACLAEIDRLLLEATELEQALEGVLLRVRNLTASQAVAVTLIDRDAPAHARSFIVGAQGGDCPVSRVNLDEELTQRLQELRSELTVPPHHLDRYSFLAPLQEQGAVSCCVWPIMAGERLAAILAVGYGDPAPPSREQLALGAECAARLRFALTNAERDEHLYRQAHFDSLTALPNRVLFRHRLSEELRHASDSGQRSALLYVDLDHFKNVNDSVGHVAGDQLLTIVAQRLRGSVKEGDTVARLGGDEFTVILRDLPSAETAGLVAERIIEGLQRPVNIAGRDHHVRASVGITVFPDDADSIDAIMRNADLAMYQAKDAGRSRAVYYDSKIARAQSPIAQSGLFRALRRREFALHYQPQFHLRSGELIGVEALLRWPSPRQGMRFPKDFLPAAEESGLIVELGAWVLESACRQLALWREQGLAPSRLALNVSAQQLRQADFAQLVHQSLQQARLPVQTLELDFTEGALAEQRPRESLRALAALGVRLALDDFGTGYSSLTHLRQHPIDALKIDGSFMQEVPDDPQACRLAETIIDMAHGLGKQVIAEGVETLAQLDFLRERGCDLAQGYVMSRPLGVAELEELLASRHGMVVLNRSAAG